MSKYLYILSVFVLAGVSALQARPNDAPERPKVAVVLSGGGAKGVAHIGALKVIEQAGIPIDIVVGTSMGAVVGGLYSIGYTPGQLDSMVMSQDWGWLLSDRTSRRNQIFSQKKYNDRYQISYSFGKKFEPIGGLIAGNNLDMLFSDLMVGFRDSIDFNSLPIPFACVAANVVDGSEVVFHSGVLADAVRASMAIPGVFTPVYTDSCVLVDGGVVNNFPTDVARQMGADVIIGVDVQSPLKTKSELVGATAVLGQLVDLAMQRGTYRQNVEFADVYIDVDVRGYSSASFNLPALDTLIARGEEAAQSDRGDLARLKHKIGLDEGYVPPQHGPYLPLNKRGDFLVYNITFDGLNPRERRWIMRSCRLREYSYMSIDRLNHCTAMLGVTTSHSNIHYSLRDSLDGFNLHFHMNNVRGNSISAGAEFDTEEIASVLVNGTFRFGKKAPMEASATARFGKRMMGQIDYALFTSPLSKFKVDYTFDRNDINIYSGGKRHLNPIYNHHFASFSFVNMNFVKQSLRLELGLAWEKFFYVSWLTNNTDFGQVDDEGLVSYFARLDFETLDSRYFARRGSSVSIGLNVYSDNFYQYKGHAPFMTVAFSWLTTFPLSERFSLIPSLYGRVLIGNDIPFPMQNMVGGRFFGRYTPQQMPFDGIRFMEMAPNTFMAAKLQGRQRIARRHYVSASFNYALADDNFLTLVDSGHNYFGASIDYGYDLRSFPLQASFGWSSISRNVSLYIQAGYLF